MTRIAIIPVRSGSKRIPKKNIKLFLGKPLVYYAIDAAIKSKLFDKIIVSTDSEEIAIISNEFGAETPFLRPEFLSDDITPTIPVIKHAIGWFLENKFDIEYCCCIYANPFVTAANLIRAFELMKNSNATSVIPVTSYPFSIYRSVRLTNLGSIEFIFNDNSLVRSQDLEEAYHDAGQFYWWNVNDLMSTDSLAELQKINRFPLIIPRSQVQDIDTLEDWDVAERLYNSTK
jgi:pseudaminic acid cytidylyltransferase